MHATVRLLRVGQPRRADDAAKSGQFIDQFSWVKYGPTVLKKIRFRAQFRLVELRESVHAVAVPLQGTLEGSSDIPYLFRRKIR